MLTKFSINALIILAIIFICLFYIPLTLSIYKKLQKLHSSKSLLPTYKTQLNKFNQILEKRLNISNSLEQLRQNQNLKLNNLSKITFLLETGIYEEKNDYYLTERRLEENKATVDLYLKNNKTSFRTILNLQNFFNFNSLKDYYKNISNIFLISNIIYSQNDLNFIYNIINNNFYNNSNKKYIIGPPCYKTIMDTNKPIIFHKYCDKVGDTIVFIKTNNTRLGGITDNSWYDNKSKKGKNVILFNLDNQLLFEFNNTYRVNSGYHFLVSFGNNDIFLGYLPWESLSKFKSGSNNSNNIENFNELLNQEIPNYSKNDVINFEYEDIEIYSIISLDD